jgi:hypothetical protein
MAFVGVEKPAKLSLVRCAFIGAAAFIVLFIAFWATSAAGALNASRTLISLFTPAPISSLAALIGGGGWALASGAAVGALVAASHNLFRSAKLR